MISIHQVLRNQGGGGADRLQKCPAHAPNSIVPLVSKGLCKPGSTHCSHAIINPKAANAMKLSRTSSYG